jgi:acyl dehydratase
MTDPVSLRALMAVDTSKVGQDFEAAEFQVEADRIRQYADAVGEDDPIYHDPDAAREVGFRHVVAPPMFVVVYSAPAMGPPILEVIGDALPRMVHGGQEFVWGEPVCAGDAITTRPTMKNIYEKDGMGFYVFESVSTNQDGAETVRATWTNIVRGV